MKSRITIEVDFENGNQPVIQILRRQSDDVRDSLITSFVQKLNGSSWCRIKWVGNYEDPTDKFERVHINPITPKEYKAEAAIMLEQARVDDEWDKQNKKAFKK